MNRGKGQGQPSPEEFWVNKEGAISCRCPLVICSFYGFYPAIVGKGTEVQLSIIHDSGGASKVRRALGRATRTAR
jgi:hypothetical protein